MEMGKKYTSFYKSDSRDIRLLKTKLKEYISTEDYERAATIRDWIDEVKEIEKSKKKKG